MARIALGILITITFLSPIIVPVSAGYEINVWEADFETELQQIPGLQLLSTVDHDFDFSDTWGSIEGLVNQSRAQFDTQVGDQRNFTVRSFVKGFIRQFVADAMSVVFKAGFYFYGGSNPLDMNIGSYSISVPNNITEFYCGFVFLFTPSELKKEFMETVDGLLQSIKEVGVPFSIVDTTPRQIPYYTIELCVKDSGIDLPLIDQDILLLVYPTVDEGYAPAIDIGKLAQIPQSYGIVKIVEKSPIPGFQVFMVLLSFTIVFFKRKQKKSD